jgi:hypothetical protein
MNTRSAEPAVRATGDVGSSGPAEVPFHQRRASQRRFPRFAPTGTTFLGRCCLEALMVERRR